MLGLIPLASDKPDLTSYPGIMMHLMVPFTTVMSFLLNDPPFGKPKPTEPLKGTIFIALYGVVMTVIFGTGMLPSEKAPYEKRNLYNKKRDIVKEKYYETKASDYIRKNMRIAVIKIDDASKRLPYEEAIIASLNKTKDFNSSSNWLGKNSPIEEIRMSGMWLSEGLNSNVLTAFKQDDLIELIKKMPHG